MVSRRASLVNGNSSLVFRASNAIFSLPGPTIQALLLRVGLSQPGSVFISSSEILTTSTWYVTDEGTVGVGVKDGVGDGAAVGVGVKDGAVVGVGVKDGAGFVGAVGFGTGVFVGSGWPIAAHNTQTRPFAGNSARQ